MANLGVCVLKWARRATHLLDLLLHDVRCGLHSAYPVSCFSLEPSQVHWQTFFPWKEKLQHIIATANWVFPLEGKVSTLQISVTQAPVLCWYIQIRWSLIRSLLFVDFSLNRPWPWFWFCWEKVSLVWLDFTFSILVYVSINTEYKS